MEKSQQLEHYIPYARFISEIMGPDSEVVLYDVKQGLVYEVIHPLDEEMHPGSEIRSLERSFLEEKRYVKEDFIVNYRALSKRKNKLKSATLFLKDGRGTPKAIITVNVNVDKLIELRDMVNTLVSGSQPYEQTHGGPFYNSFDVSVEGMVTASINEELGKYGVEPTRLSYEEKMEVVQALDRKGVFLVKGAIAELATTLKTTETTIYRYLNKLQSS